METQKLIERVAKLRYFNKLTYDEIGAVIGYSSSAVQKFIQKAVEMDLLPGYSKGNEMTFNNSKEYREQKMLHAHNKMVNRMTDDIVIENASLTELINAAKKTFDMMRLENDKSTSNNAMSGLLKLVDAANEDGEL